MTCEICREVPGVLDVNDVSLCLGCATNVLVVIDAFNEDAELVEETKRHTLHAIPEFEMCAICITQGARTA